MAGTTFRNVLGHLGSLLEGRPGSSTPDQELLTRFLQERDENAFATLVGRHGAMVLGVCQRILRNTHDAEDACQAVFLVLARKADSVCKRASLASWLHGVSWHLAHKLQTSLARRVARESVTAAARPAVSEPADLSWREALHITDEELQRLPPVYRAPLVLCYLEGRTQDEAARELGWSLGAFRGRLNRGRAKLRANLIRRGVTGAAALGVAALVPALGSAAVPPALIAASVQASLSVAAGQNVPAQVPDRVLALAQESLQTSSRGSLATSAVVGACVVVVGVLLALFAGHRPVTRSGDTGPTVARTWSAVSRLEVPDAHLWTVAFSPDGKRIAAGAGGVMPTAGELRVWDVASGSVVFTLKTTRSVRCVSFAPDGRTLATAEHDGAARVRDAANGNVLHTLRGHDSNIDAVAFSPSGKTLATSSWDNTVKLWDSATGDEVQTLAGGPGQVFGMTYCSDGVLAGGGTDGTVRIWQAAAGRTLFRLRGHDGTIHGLASAPPEGTLVATASWDKTVRLWDPTNGKPVATLYGHSEPVLAVAFSRDGRTLASGSGAWGHGTRETNVPRPGEVILWDVTTHQARARLPHKDRVFGVAFSPDGNTLATACWDGSVTLWKGEGEDRPLPENPPKDRERLQFVMAAGQDGGPAPPTDKEYAEEYHPTLKDRAKEVPGLLVYGPEAPARVKFESEGLRITLPAGYPRQRSGTGVVTDFGLRGDFEITLNFEILQESRPGAGGNPTDLRLVVVPDERPEPDVWHKASQNRAFVARELPRADDAGGFLADATKWTHDIPKDQWGNEIFNNIEQHKRQYAGAIANAGRLRLVRRGPELYFFTSDGPDKEFVLLHKDDFGTTDVKNVRILGSTAGPRASLDVRVSDLHVRADGFLRGTEGVLLPAGGTAGRKWQYIGLAIAVAVAIACLLGIWLYARRRSRAALAAQPVGSAGSRVIAFKCPGCGQRLKAKNDLAGAKVKCPQCGQAVDVPAVAPGTAEDVA